MPYKCNLQIYCSDRVSNLIFYNRFIKIKSFYYKSSILNHKYATDIFFKQIRFYSGKFQTPSRKKNMNEVESYHVESFPSIRVINSFFPKKNLLERSYFKCLVKFSRCSKYPCVDTEPGIILTE